jgi:hypothetical protein
VKNAVPGEKTQRYLFWIGFVGVFSACFGCGLAARNEITAANAFLILAWLILVPLFGYLIRTRRYTKRIVRQREQQRQAELEALAHVDELLKDTGERDGGHARAEEDDGRVGAR